MSDPVLIGDYGNVFIYYTCDRNPTSSEPLVYSGYPNLLLLWWNKLDNKLFWCVNDTPDAMIWQEQASITNLVSMISNLGFKINVPRSYSTIIDPSFDNEYLPSLNNDTFVLATVNINLEVFQNSFIEVQINDGNGYVTFVTESINLVVIDKTFTLSFIVPANSTYKILENGSGTNTILSIMELSL